MCTLQPHDVRRVQNIVSLRTVLWRTLFTLFLKTVKKMRQMKQD